MSSSDLQLIWYAIVALSCAPAWIVQEKLFQRIKQSYYQKWVEIGEPGWKTAMSSDPLKFRKATLTFRYLFKGDPVLDGDLTIRKLKNLTKFVYLMIFIVVTIFFIVTIILDSSF